MHIKIEITKEAIAVVAWFVIGIFFIIYSINTYFKVNNAIPLEQLQPQNCTKGQFVTGKINSYLNKDINPIGKPVYSGTSQTHFIGRKAYEFYTVPIDGEYYIRIMVADKIMLEQLEKILSGSNESVLFEGKIIKAPSEVNFRWFNGIEEVSQGKVKNIISDYVIYQAPIKEKIKVIYGGIVFIAGALLQYKSMGGLKKIIYK